MNFEVKTFAFLEFGKLLYINNIIHFRIADINRHAFCIVNCEC